MRTLTSIVEAARKGLSPARTWASLAGRLDYLEQEGLPVPTPDEFVALLGDPTAPFWKDLGFFPRVSPEARESFIAAFRRAMAPPPPVVDVLLGWVRPTGLWRPVGEPDADDGVYEAVCPEATRLWPAAPAEESAVPPASVVRHPDGPLTVRREIYCGVERWELQAADGPETREVYRTPRHMLERLPSHHGTRMVPGVVGRVGVDDPLHGVLVQLCETGKF